MNIDRSPREVLALVTRRKFQILAVAFGALLLSACLAVVMPRKYEAATRSAGFGAAGCGVFFDLAGDDTMRFGDQCAGVGLSGVGIFVDRSGDDEQRAGTQSFGCGLPGGLGLFVDWRGADVRSRVVQGPIVCGLFSRKSRGPRVV